MLDDPGEAFYITVSQKIHREAGAGENGYQLVGGTGKPSTTRAIEAWASTMTSTGEDHACKAAATKVSWIAASPRRRAATAPSLYSREVRISISPFRPAGRGVANQIRRGFQRRLAAWQ